MGRMTRALSFLLCGSLLPLVSPTAADTLVFENFTQNGGTFNVVNDTVLLVTHDSNDPTLALTNSAIANFAGATVIGSLTGESGTLFIDGGSTLANTGTLTSLGTYGSQTVFRGVGYIGLNSGSTGTATVTGAGSTWANSSNLSVGYSGQGTLLVEDGGAVTNSTGYIGRFSGSTGTATVTGAGSTWTNNGNLILGGWSLTNATTGTGALLVLDGGLVEVDDTTKVHEDSSIILSTNGLLVTNTLDNDGMLGGTGTITGNVVNAGTVAPGLSPGILFIDGDYTQTSAGLLEFEIGGPLPGTDYDVLQVSGQVTLAGMVSILLDGYTPALGDTFQILEFDSLLDDGFSFDFSGAPLSGGLQWDTSQFLSSGILQLTPEPGRAMLLVTGLLILLSRRGRR